MCLLNWYYAPISVVMWVNSICDYGCNTTHCYSNEQVQKYVNSIQECYSRINNFFNGLSQWNSILTTAIRIALSSYTQAQSQLFQLSLSSDTVNMGLDIITPTIAKCEAQWYCFKYTERQLQIVLNYIDFIDTPLF